MIIKKNFDIGKILSDNRIMKFKEILGIIGAVLKDWRVIVTLVAMLFVMGATNFILKYKKKPKKQKKEKAATPAPKKEEKKEEKEGEEAKE